MLTCGVFRLDTTFTVPFSTQGNKRLLATFKGNVRNTGFGENLWWTCLSFRGRGNTPSHFMLQAPKVNSRCNEGICLHLACKDGLSS